MASVPREAMADRWGLSEPLDERSRLSPNGASEELQALREAISELRAYSPRQQGSHVVELLEDTHTAIAATVRALKLLQSHRDSNEPDEPLDAPLEGSAREGVRRAEEEEEEGVPSSFDELAVLHGVPAQAAACGVATSRAHGEACEAHAAGSSARGEGSVDCAALSAPAEAECARRRVICRKRSTLVRYLVPLQDLLGPMPARRWQDEWNDLVIEMLLLRGYSRRDYANHAWVMQNNTIEHNKVNFGEEIDQLVSAGWEAERAIACVLLFAVRQSMARALRERDPCFAASTYALTDLLTEEARKQQRSPNPPMHRLYINLRGAHGLEVDDPAWSQLEIPDANGFRGLISNAVVKGECDPRNFSELGFCARETYVNNLVKYEVQNSDVVCFESAPADEEGLHAAVLFGDGPRGAFPPNCLFELIRVVEDGFVAPSGVYVRQRLLVVRATFAWQLTTLEAQRVARVVLTSREARYTRALIGTCFFRGGGAGVRLPLEVARHIARIAAECRAHDEESGRET